MQFLLINISIAFIIFLVAVFNIFIEKIIIVIPRNAADGEYGVLFHSIIATNVYTENKNVKES